MKPIPTDAHNEAAKAFLARHFPNHTIGQWAELAELLAEHSAAATPTPKPRRGMYVYEILLEDTTHALHGTACEFFATDAEHARQRREENELHLRASLRFVGIWTGLGSDKRFECHLEYAVAPEWAKQWLDEQRAARLPKRRRRVA